MDTSPRGNSDLFDAQPFDVGGFRFESRGVFPLDSPTLPGWTAALQFAAAAEESSPFWVEALLAYGKLQPAWRAKWDQALSDAGMAPQTLYNHASIDRHVSDKAKALAPSFSHLRAVTGLEPAEQEELLQEARTEQWTVKELTRAKRQRSRRTVLSGQAETMHTVEVTVRVAVEAPSAYEAEQKAWSAVKTATKTVPHAHVVAAHAMRGAPLKKASGA